MLSLASQLSRRTALAATAIAPLTLAANCAEAQPSASDAEVLAVVERLYVNYAAIDLAALEPLIADDIHFEDPTFRLSTNDKAGVMEMGRTLQNFRNIRFERHNTIVAAPWVVVQQTQSAETTGSDGAVRRFSVKGCAVFEVRGGQIAQWYDYYDVLTFREQMGLG